MVCRLRLFLLICCCVLVSAPANGADAVEEMVAATFKITNQSSTATCFVIARQKKLIVVTAAHVFEKMSGEECRIVLRNKQADGSFVRKEVPLKIRAGNKPLWVKHPQVDVAAMKLKLPADQAIPALNFEQIANETAIKKGALRLASEVWIPCYPAQLESTSAGFSVLRRGTVASFPLTPVSRFKTFLVDYSSFGGDSGAPVMVRHRGPGEETEHALIVGLVMAKHRETTKSVTPIEERTVHRSLGLGIIVHADLIRETIERVK
jgi:hypothetical protein